MKATKKLLSTVAVAALSVSPVLVGASAMAVFSASIAEAAVVRSISVSGNQRVANQTIADFVNYTPGKNYTGADLDDAITRLFRTGLFSDVSVSVRGSTLVIVVDELSVINQVVFQGNRRLKDERLRQVVRLRPRATFDQSTLDADVDAIADSYAAIGRSDVTVSADVVDLGQNRVNVVYRIAEGGKTRIDSINFVGNQAFGDRRLAGVISTKESSILRFLSSADVYDEQRIAADEEALRRFYFNRGYADFRVLSSGASTDPTTGDITITFEVSEGERYTFGNIDIDSTVFGVEPDTLRRRVASQPGKRYSAKDVEDTLIAISDELAASGFPFAEVTPIGNRNFESQTIDVTYVVDQGQRAFIERIDIVGNDRTRDYVIRREFDVAEGDAFNQVLIRRAQQRLEALDFFATVNVRTRQGSAPDRVVIVVEAVDKPTGEFGIGAGYSTTNNEGSGGVSFDASISDRNFLGRGQTIRLSVGGGQDNRTYNVSFTEPYFLGYRMSATFSGYQKNGEFSKNNYEAEERGGSVNFGIPLNDRFSANFGYFYQSTAYSLLDEDKAPGAQVADVVGTDYTTSAIRYGLTYNSVDNRVTPREGIFANVQQTVAGLGGDAEYIRTTADSRFYQMLSEEADIVGMIRIGGGNVTSLGNDLRGVDHFSIGPDKLRGFDSNGIGPTVDGVQVGGKNYLHVTAEATAPMPFVPRDIGLRTGAFIDAGTLWGSDVPGAENTDMEWRSSAGVSLIWQSPFAPLRLDYAFPISSEEEDDEREFSFSVSTAF